jgi:predicted dehydrogenase
VTQVYASMANHFFEPHRAYQVEDMATVALTLQKDVIATTMVGRAPTVRAALGDFGLRIYADKGMLALDHNQPRLEVYGTAGSVPLGFPFEAEPGDDAVEPLIDAFVDCILTGRTPLRGVRDGRRLVEILTAAYRSNATGRVVNVSPIF